MSKKYILVKRETLFYIFAKNKWLNEKQPNSHNLFLYLICYRSTLENPIVHA